MKDDVRRSLALVGLLPGLILGCGGYRIEGNGRGVGHSSPEDEENAAQSYALRALIALDGRCLSMQLVPDARSGATPEMIVEALAVDDSEQASCNMCDVRGRAPIAFEADAIVDAVRTHPLAESSSWNCFCIVEQLTGSAANACLHEKGPEATPWDGTERRRNKGAADRQS